MSATRTDDEARALGERWIKAGGGWRAGMVEGTWGSMCLYPLPSGRPKYDDGDWFPSDWPDFRHGCTRGAALEVVRERLGCPGAFLAPDPEQDEEGRYLPTIKRWRLVEPIGWTTVAEGASEEGALVAALEAAGKEGR